MIFIFTVWIVFVDSFSLTPSHDYTQEDNFIVQKLFVNNSRVAFQFGLCLESFSSFKAEHSLLGENYQTCEGETSRGKILNYLYIITWNLILMHCFRTQWVHIVQRCTLLTNCSQSVICKDY